MGLSLDQRGRKELRETVKGGDPVAIDAKLSTVGLEDLGRLSELAVAEWKTQLGGNSGLFLARLSARRQTLGALNAIPASRPASATTPAALAAPVAPSSPARGSSHGTRQAPSVAVRSSAAEPRRVA
ncbi:MAG: hypothetical protein UT33_C0009G0053 [Candidatus Peregrinibacteria bacterium GW2011_GWC2_39_14]|nr:MAG: hypothetical protein US92_C0005G0053 [Candidatus Peregrinibacteria bacterium GW2011_GWA2_38_36]KKR06602.1 MAG: hypothetical protein UT33_C0009G0053 [Candidatus Peregrinibacteria bacterium GW2011_GWC2_39_14]